MLPVHENGVHVTVDAVDEDLAQQDAGVYRTLACIDCNATFASPTEGQRGRPRKRCPECSPVQRGQPSRYSTHGWILFRDCARCSRSFIAESLLALYCGDRCRNRASNVAATTKRRDRSPRACLGCGKPFAPAYGDMRRSHCSIACRRRTKTKCSIGAAHWRRVRKFGGRYEHFDKHLVFARDGYRCQICGIATPKALAGKRKPNSPTLDHVTALSKGGDHTVENTQCACWKCNSRKKAGPPAGQLALFAEQANSEIRARRRTA